MGQGIFVLNLTVEDDDGGVSTYITTVSLNVTAPLAPNLFINVSQDGEDVILYWEQPLISEVDHYRIYRAESQTDFDFDDVWINTSINMEPGESSSIPLRSMWNDTNAALPGDGNYKEEYYYIIRAVDEFGRISQTSRTVGKWTRTFPEGLSSFSLPLEPIEGITTDYLTESMNAAYIRYIDSSSHKWLKHKLGDGSQNNTQMKLGEGYEVKFASQTVYTFSGLPGAMIISSESSGFSGFDPVTEARNLAITVQANGDVNLSWQEPASMVSGDWYEVYYSNKRDGFFGLLNVDYFFVNPKVYFGNNTATHINAQARNPGTRLYYLVVPFNSSGFRGTGTYSIGIWTEELLDRYDTFGIPLKQSFNETADWYCDNIPDTEGINYFNDIYHHWRWHATRMPKGAFDPILVMVEGYQISTSGTTKFTFVGI